MSFVRSTTLDSWTEEQLQTMSVGGNQRGRTFFKQHGWDEVGSDKIEAKYSSRAAQLYKRQLEKDVQSAMRGNSSSNSGAQSMEHPSSPTFEDDAPSKQGQEEPMEKPNGFVPAMTKSKAAAVATVGPTRPRARAGRCAAERGVWW
jgi:hypothetical protein